MNILIGILVALVLAFGIYTQMGGFVLFVTIAGGAAFLYYDNQRTKEIKEFRNKK